MSDILVIYPYLPHYRACVFNDLATELSFKGVTVHIAGSGEANDGILPIEDLEKFGAYNFRWVNISNVKARFKNSVYILWQTGVWRHFFRHEIQHVIILEGLQYLPNWLYLILGKLLRKRVYVWGHGLYGNEKWLKRWIRIGFLWLSSGVFTYGFRAKHLIEGYFSAPPVFVVYNSCGKALPDLKEGRFYNLKNQPMRILFLGRLTAVKRVDLLIRAMAILNSENYCLEIVGDGPEKRLLMDLADSLKLSKIKFTPATYNEGATANIFAQSDVLVSPGNTGLNCIHALSYGVPVVTHNSFEWQMPEVEAIRPGLNGCFFKRDSVDDLAAAIRNVRALIMRGYLSVADCRQVVDRFYNSEAQARIFTACFKNISHESFEI